MRGIRRTALGLASLALAAPPATASDVEPITVCAHVSITGSAPTPHHPSRFGGFYFDYLNAEQGGIHGRPVRWLAFDDASYPSGALAAVEKCAREGARLIVGTSFNRDVTQAVANWATRRRVHYIAAALAPPAIAGTDSRLLHGFGLAGTEAMRELAQAVANNAEALAGRRRPVVGLISGGSGPNTDAEDDAFMAAAQERGLEAWRYTGSSASQFWTEARLRQTSIVAVNAAVNTFLFLMRNKPPDMDPGFAGTHDLASNMTADLASLSRMMVFSDHPVYDPSDDSLPWALEIDTFLDIFHRYSPEQNPPPGDSDWSSYLLAKRIARVLDAADGALSTASIASLLSSYAESEQDSWPSCPLHLTPSDRTGGETWNTFVSRPRGWVQPSTCARAPVNLDYTRHTPSIACDQVALVGDELSCTISEANTGVASYSVDVTGLDGGSSFAATPVGCPAETTAAIPVPAGASVVSITATSCDGWRATATVAVVATG